ncbi:putative oxidoreductase [Actinoplanes missouriensis 431]|uniref:Putative oxidoreductase n=1 Tax=Actinoplanes missouriensis (strain ATCC 14538 / DSM 43046 / CBS 188.64 / JCM 3121 / NBRC 102363 / NCIMB 12654 / NRRL B-3342 / UNCC 431) TaxID=512565 RepID=I0HFB4_ACTM4|nr:ferredoxin reductase [Actinoplanes missouriensis]BAL91701.1 putative oxidoreductase [Actinoplanes missouriensis 431]
MKNRISWRVATVSSARWETASARTLVLDVPDWPGHLPGQHIDVRLTAEDGYTAQRSYSIASAWTPAPSATGAGSAGAPGTVELTIQRLDDGEVSPYLTDVVEPGDQIELRGPVGGWFVWREKQTAPVLLIAGGSGIVPLMAMIRARGEARGRQPFRLIYSVRTPEDAAYADELRLRVRENPGLDVHFVYTRKAPDGWPTPPKRIDVAAINSHGWPPDFQPDCYVCGPTSFVETAADILVALGHDPKRIRTERFGGA